MSNRFIADRDLAKPRDKRMRVIANGFGVALVVVAPVSIAM